MATKKEILLVSELFYSIQGEGQTMGVPAVFLRLGGCNLLCETKNWVCDTIEVWRKSKATKFEDVLPEWMEEKLFNHSAHLVITGGEPLMHQQVLNEYLKYLTDKNGGKEIICEIETNGTITPNLFLLNYVSYWNVSPKLPSAVIPSMKDITKNELALNSFSMCGPATIFKFVVSNEQDLKDIEAMFLPYINKRQLVLMPAGSSQEELNRTRVMVAEMCIKLDCRYSDRLHIVIWNQKTGV